MLIQVTHPFDSDAPSSAEGWERRFTADAARVREATELYRKLGYEVRTEAVRSADFRDECEGCHEVALQFQTIYTRKKSG
jgi:hypothetical protein